MILMKIDFIDFFLFIDLYAQRKKYLGGGPRPRVYGSKFPCFNAFFDMASVLRESGIFLCCLAPLTMKNENYFFTNGASCKMNSSPG